jgi:hypothetical protein
MARRKYPGLAGAVHRQGGLTPARGPMPEGPSKKTLAWAIATAKDQAAAYGRDAAVTVDIKTKEIEVTDATRADLYPDIAPLLATVRPDGTVEWTPLGELKRNAQRILADPKQRARVKRHMDASRTITVAKKYTMTDVLKAARMKTRGSSLAYKTGRDVVVAVTYYNDAPSAVLAAAMAAQRLSDRHGKRLPEDPKVMAKALARVATVVGLGSVDDHMEGLKLRLGL